MNFLKISPVRFFVVGAGITLFLNAALYISQKVNDGKIVSVTSVKKPQFGYQISTWFAGNGDSQTTMKSELTNGMGMRFVKLPDLDIAFGVHEVTREQFRFFAESSGLTDQRWLNRITRAGLSQPENHPVVNVSWEEANQFCQWLSKQENTSYRLPTDYEWSVAAGLTPETSFLSPCLRSKEATEQYFWGKNWITDRPVGNYADQSYQTITGTTGCFPFDDGFPATAPVASFLPNDLGIYDMGGNVSEWVYDWYRSRDEFKTVRGASYGSGMLHKDVHYKGFRAMSTPTFRSEHFGFRVIAENADTLQPTKSDPQRIEVADNTALAPVITPPPVMEPYTPPVAEYTAPPIEITEPVAQYTPPAAAAPPVEEIVEPFPTLAPQEMVATTPAPFSNTPMVAVEETSEYPSTPVRVTYTGSDGINIRQETNFDKDKKLGALFAQSRDPILQIGPDTKVDTETWVNVEVKGWIPTKNSTHTYLKDRNDGTWEVVWNKPGDRYVSMRAGSSSDDTLICKVASGTHVEKLDEKRIGKRHYIYGRIYGWVVKRNSSRSYIKNL